MKGYNYYLLSLSLHISISHSFVVFLPRTENLTHYSPSRRSLCRSGSSTHNSSLSLTVTLLPSTQLTTHSPPSDFVPPRRDYVGRSPKPSLNTEAFFNHHSFNVGGSVGVGVGGTHLFFLFLVTRHVSRVTISSLRLCPFVSLSSFEAFKTFKALEALL